MINILYRPPVKRALRSIAKRNIFLESRKSCPKSKTGNPNAPTQISQHKQNNSELYLRQYSIAKASNNMITKNTNTQHHIPHVSSAISHAVGVTIEFKATEGQRQRRRKLYFKL